MLFRKLAVWFRKRDVNKLKKWVSRFTVCGHVGHYVVESKLTRVESKLVLQLLSCVFDICLFLFDRIAM